MRFFIDMARVNIDDLIGSYNRPGAIVRCEGDPSECVRVIYDEPRIISRDCKHCGTVVSWEYSEIPPKCPSCGAPPK